MPPDFISTALYGCKSRRNLAASLAAKLFSVEERSGSNCRGVLGKSPLDVNRVKAINCVCMQHSPLQRLETQLQVAGRQRNENSHQRNVPKHEVQPSHQDREQLCRIFSFTCLLQLFYSKTCFFLVRKLTPFLFTFVLWNDSDSILYSRKLPDLPIATCTATAIMVNDHVSMSAGESVVMLLDVVQFKYTASTTKHGTFFLSV